MPKLPSLARANPGAAQPRRSTPRRLLIALAATSVLVAASWYVRSRQPAPVDLPSDPAGALYTDAPTRAPVTDGLIAKLQDRLKQYPNDTRSYGLLGAAYLQKARETADPAFYVKAEQVLPKALTGQAGDFEPLTTLGVLALARHQFKDGLSYGQQALALNPFSARAMGVVVDGYVELGDYPAALETVQRMVDTRPDMSSYARVAYMRELNGDVAGALEAMRLAAQAGSGVPENTAWTLSQVGGLLLNQGDLAAAETEYQAALRALPNYVAARAGLARIAAARGDLDSAISSYEQIVAVMPLSEYVIALGDCYTAAGRPADAQRQYALVQVLSQLQRANGVDVDLEITLFEADHPDQFAPMADTVARARQVYARRRTLYAADVLAWSLYQSGAYAEAKTYSTEALRLNTQDALLWFHAGMIAAAQGDAAGAKARLDQALALNPNFSLLWTAVAQQQLDALRAQ